MARSLLMVVLAAGASAGYALLIPSTGEATPCVVGTLADYIGLSDDCTIGDKTFSGFTDFFSGINSSDITVTPLPSASNPGLKFSSTLFSVSTPVDKEIDFFYDVSSSGAKITGTDVSLTNAKTTGTGDVSLSKFTTFGESQVDLTLDTATNTTSASATYNPALSSLSVEDDLILDSGTDGTASVDSFTQHFSEPVTAPEPPSFTLLGTALFGLGWLRRRGMNLA